MTATTVDVAVKGVPGTPGVDRRHRPSDFLHERTNFQFIAHSKRYLIIFLVVVLGGLGLLFVRGLNLGIDFEGGVSWQIDAAKGVHPNVADVRNLVSKAGVNDFKATIGTNPQTGNQTIRVQAKVQDDPSDTVRHAIATATGRPFSEVQFTGVGDGGRFVVTKVTEPSKVAVTNAVARVVGAGQHPAVTINGDQVSVTVTKLPSSTVDKVSNALLTYANGKKTMTPTQLQNAQKNLSISTVGPTWGSTVSHKAIDALIVFFLVLALYLTVRFELKMAIAAIVAVIHDIIFTVAAYAVFHFTVSPATVTAFLTILGFSLYDTVVVFDKIKENQSMLVAQRGMTYGEMANRSLNQVLMRSLSTSFVALMPVLSLLLIGSGAFGATALEDFALALFAGLFIGTYSSVFVATPLLVWWKEREPQYRALKERAARLGAVAAAPPPAPKKATPAPAPTPAPKLVRVPEAATDNGADAESPEVMLDPREIVEDVVDVPSDWDTSGVPGPTAVGRTQTGRPGPKPRQQRGKKRKR
jgi:preprotein translocase subunit SecF